MDEQEKFEAMVNLLAELSSEGKYPDEIKSFEDVIKTSGNGEAYFGAAKEDWDSLEEAWRWTQNKKSKFHKDRLFT